MQLRTKLLIYEYKERWPVLTEEDVSEIFCLNINEVKKLFKEEYLIIPSKMNN